MFEWIHLPFLYVIFVRLGISICHLLSENCTSVDEVKPDTYDKKVIKWNDDNIKFKRTIELYRDEINWNLQMQLTWFGVLLGSGLGLIQILPTEKNISHIRYVIYFILTCGIDISMSQVLKHFQKIPRNKMIMYAAIRQEENNKLHVKKSDFSGYQKVLLNFPKGMPTLKTSLESILALGIWMVSYLLLINNLN